MHGTAMLCEVQGIEAIRAGRPFRTPFVIPDSIGNPEGLSFLLAPFVKGCTDRIHGQRGICMVGYSLFAVVAFAVHS
jgi:hypothetical protein